MKLCAICKRPYPVRAWETPWRQNCDKCCTSDEMARWRAHMARIEESK